MQERLHSSTCCDHPRHCFYVVSPFHGRTVRYLCGIRDLTYTQIRYCYLYRHEYDNRGKYCINHLTLLPGQMLPVHLHAAFPNSGIQVLYGAPSMNQNLRPDCVSSNLFPLKTITEGQRNHCMSHCRRHMLQHLRRDRNYV
jgi:hypothetical protein